MSITYVRTVRGGTDNSFPNTLSQLVDKSHPPPMRTLAHEFPHYITCLSLGMHIGSPLTAPRSPRPCPRGAVGRLPREPGSRVLPRKFEFRSKLPPSSFPPGREKSHLPPRGVLRHAEKNPTFPPVEFSARQRNILPFPPWSSPPRREESYLSPCRVLRYAQYQTDVFPCLRLYYRVEAAQQPRGPAHVPLHTAHPIPGLDRQTPRVKNDSLSDQRLVRGAPLRMVF